MKRALPFVIGLSFLLSSCLVLGPKRGKSRHHSKCHPSERWDGHKCKHKGKAKGHDKHKKHKKPKKHKDKHHHR